jgi:hypothetical protein
MNFDIQKRVSPSRRFILNPLSAERRTLQQPFDPGPLRSTGAGKPRMTARDIAFRDVFLKNI